MPTECERSLTSPSGTAGSTQATTEGGVASAALIAAEIQSSNLHEELSHQQQISMMEGDMSTSQTSTTSNGSSCNGGIRKTSITSPDPTAYVAKARVTRPTPPPPPYNPMQFVQIKPCNLYQTAQEQLKKAEEVKKIKEIRKEEPEDWQNNLDNWKSSRRKRVEHIIDRVVEVKKLELEEHDRTRRKSKTFSELIENRGERVGRPGLNKLASLAVYNEDESNDLSDLGIGTSSASGKSSLSEDYDNNSVMSDNAAELDKAISNSNHKPLTDSTTREYISSPGYETSSSTAPASSPDPCEYTYEGAIQDYKQRVSRAAASGLTSQALNKLTTQQQHNSKESTPERAVKETAYPPRRGSKIEDRLIGFEVQSPSEECVSEKNKVDVPKIDISKRKEIFESQTSETKSTSTVTVNNIGSGSGAPRVTLRDRFKPQESTETVEVVIAKKDVKRMSGDITSIKERLQNLEQQQNLVNGANGASKTTANKLVDIPVPPLKERLSSLQNAVTKEEVRKPPVALVDARQLEIMKSEEEKAKQTIKEEVTTIATNVTNTNNSATTANTTTTTTTITSNQIPLEHPSKTEEFEVDRDDSGIHTADDIDIVEDRLNTQHIKKEQELKLNAAIEALAMEEKQFAEAASAVNQIEAEFEELSLGSVALPPLASSTNSNGTSASASSNTITNDHMEYSVSSTNQHTICLSPSSSPTSSDSCNTSSLIPNAVVKGEGGSQPPVAGSSLRRKPTNEMVHAKNLLKIFKETFQNDIELDEDDDDHRNEQETKQIPSDQNPKENPLSVSVKTRIFENSLAKSGNDQPLPSTSAKSPVPGPKVPPLVTTHPYVNPNSPVSTTIIPRCVTPTIKSPLSPMTVRSTTKFKDETPPGSPFASRKHDSQFSINGRVEIFNSKNMATPAGNLPKTPTPTMTARKTFLPHITTTNATPTSSSATPTGSAPNDIRLPEQPKHQQQPALTALQSQKAATATSTVIEPLSTQETKSMPSRQMVNEPQTPIATATVTTTTTATTATVVATLDVRETPNQNQSNCDAVKQQQQPPHQPEVVVCAPPITIVNPDELPKPNTVKNLSSCFQQQHHDAPAPVPLSGSKLISPKPLPRSRIPQATPPQSPVALKRNVAASTTEKTLVIWPPPSTTSTTPPSDEEKKLSLISTSSTSSNSTVCTVIEANKKLSMMSNSSTISTDSSIAAPTIVTTNAQVHKDPEREVHGVAANKQGIKERLDKTAENSHQTFTEPKNTVSKISKPIPSKVTPSETISSEAKTSEYEVSETKPSQPKSSDTQQITDYEFKELLNNFIQIETEFSQTCEMRPKTLENSLTTKKTTTEKKSINESQPKRLQPVPRQQSPKIARKDSEKPLKTVAFSEEVSSEPKATEQKTFEPKVAQPKATEYKTSEPKATQLKATEHKTSEPKETQKKDFQAETADDNSAPDVDIKALQNDFLRIETEFSQTCETKPMSSTVPFSSPLQPIKVVIRDNEAIKGNVQTPSLSQATKVAELPSSPQSPNTSANESENKTLPNAQQQTPTTTDLAGGSEAKTPSKLAQNKKSPLTVDVSHGSAPGPISPETKQTLPSTPLSPSSQLFRTTKPLVVSTLYDKYVTDDTKSLGTDKPFVTTTKMDFQPPNNQRPLIPSRNKEEKPTTPTIVIPAEVPILLSDCSPNDSSLYKLASSAPHSPVSTGSHVDNPIDLDAALCNSLLTSMAATPDMVNFQRQQTVEEIPCQKVDVQNMPVEKVVSSTGCVDISKEDLKQSEGFVSKIIHRMQSPIMKRQKPVEEELCLKVDIRDMPDGKVQPTTDFKSVSSSEIQKCDKFFSSGLGKPQSPITEARAAHSKALIETCEKIIAEEKQANNQIKSSLPAAEPNRGTPILQKKSKIPKPLPSCCKGAESMSEADFQVKPTEPKSPSSQPSTPKDDAVIARMHVVETQIKVTTTTPPSTPKDDTKPQASLQQPPKKTKNIFDFIKKNFGVGGSQKEGDDQVDSKTKAVAQQPLAPPPPSVVKSDNKVLVLTPQDVQNFDHVTYDEIHNVDNSKFYLPADDVAPPPLPKSPAPVNIEITRKIITNEIVEDGKTETELTDEIDALLDVELNKLNHEIDELDKAGKK